ncbi:MAG: YkgJ family cysteine cluster protein [Methanoregula sp.]|nr:YkgJ family cysteine cluster protein [Methanoregula sp.]
MLFPPGTILSPAMAAFECNRCGKCCSSFGSFIMIERQLNDRDYYCRYSVTNDLFPVHVDAEYADEVSERTSVQAGPGTPAGKKSCPFLCRTHDGNGFTCAVYATRPPVCRGFRCYRMLVYDRNGHYAGKVIGAGEISTSDEELTCLWKEKIAAIPHAHPSGANDPVWVKKVTGILAAYGYRGDAVE